MDLLFVCPRPAARRSLIAALATANGLCADRLAAEGAVSVDRPRCDDCGVDGTRCLLPDCTPAEAGPGGWLKQIRGG